MKKLKDFIRQADLFGIEVKLNFDGEREKHTTLPGGIISILLYGFYVFYFIFLWLKLIGHQQDINAQIFQAQDLNQLGFVNLNETKTVWFYQIKGGIVDGSLQNLGKYLDIYFEEERKDYYVNTNIKTRVPIKFCTQDDFGYDDQSIKEFQSWNGTYIICPDYTNIKTFQLSDDGYGMKQTVINSYFNFCNPSLRQDCVSQQDTINKIKDFRIKLYTWSEQFNFYEYKKEPNFLNQIQRSIMYPGSLGSNQLQNLFFIRFNSYQTQDDIVQYGQSTYQDYFYDVSNLLTYFMPRSSEDLTLIKTTFQLDAFSYSYTRNGYNILNLLGDFGGLTSITQIIFAVVLSQVAFQSFILKASKRLYLVKSIDKQFLKKPNMSKEKNEKLYGKKFEEKLENEFKEKIQNHSPIHLSFRNITFLCLSQTLGKIFCKCCWPQHQKVTKIFEQGRIRVEKDLNIIKILKTLRTLKNFSKMQLITPQQKFELSHHQKNLIYLDTQQQDDSQLQNEKQKDFDSNKKLNDSQNDFTQITQIEKQDKSQNQNSPGGQPQNYNEDQKNTNLSKSFVSNFDISSQIINNVMEKSPYRKKNIFQRAVSRRNEEKSIEIQIIQNLQYQHQMEEQKENVRKQNYFDDEMQNDYQYKMQNYKDNQQNHQKISQMNSKLGQINQAIQSQTIQRKSRFES